MSNRGGIVGNSSNVFAALRKTKSSKGKGGASKSEVAAAGKEAEEKVIWTPAPLKSTSWADVDDEDDEDYFANTAPPQALWASNKAKYDNLNDAEESESDIDLLDEVDNDLEEENDSEPEDQEHSDFVEKPLVPAVKEPERQLSKKELRKKELQELDDILADLKISPNDKNGQVEPQGADVEKKKAQAVEAEETNGSEPAESKSAKKKKKKAKSKETQNQSTQEEANTEADQAEEDTPVVDVKEQLRKMASMKKKKATKETDSAAKAAAAEAAARRQKLEAAKKKEKSNHYNQQPAR